MTSIYQNHPLNRSRTIRLLIWKRSPDHERLSYEFSIANLDDKKAYYVALSYVWGNPEKSASITVNGLQVGITQSLHGALKKAQRTIVAEGNYHSCIPGLWADQICINQQNLAERSSQVGMMGDVYSGAAVVYISLGDSLTAASAVSSLNNLNAQISRDMVGHQTFDDMPDPHQDVINSLNHLDWTAVRTMLQNPWFRRAWVVQESGLARRATVMYDAYHFDWLDLMKALGWLCHPGHRLFHMHRLSGWTFFQIWVSFDIRSRSKIDMYRPFNFLDLLSHSARTFAATNPRDHIFAFLGHPAATLQDSKTGCQSAIIKPNYEKTTEGVYLEFAKTWLEKYRLPYLLSCVCHRDLPGSGGTNSGSICTGTKLPSWCPRWNYMPLGGSRLLSQRSKPGAFNSANSTEFQFSILADNSLSVKGIVYDTVHASFETWNELPSPPDIRSDDDSSFNNHEIQMILKMSYLLWQIMKLSENTLPSLNLISQGIETAFVTSLIAPDGGIKSLAERRNIYLNQFKHCLLEVERRKVFPEAHTGADELYEAALKMCISASKTWKPEDTPLPNPANLMANIKTITDSRRLFVTNGGFVGLGPDVTSPGDVCCVIAGADVPWIMRQPTGSSAYLLAGECYIDGKMYGEATRSQEGLELAWEDTVIQ